MTFRQILVILSLTFAASHVHAQGRVAFSPNTLVLLPSDSIEVSVSLSEPIIVPDPPGYVTVDLKSGDERVSFSPMSLTWADTEWFQSKTFLITMTGNEAPGNEFSFASLGVAVGSNSEFYNGYIPIFSISAGRVPLLIDSFEAVPTPATPLVHRPQGAL